TEDRRLSHARELRARCREVPRVRPQQVIATLLKELTAEAGIPAAFLERGDARGADLGERAVADAGDVSHGTPPQAARPRARRPRAASASRSIWPAGSGPSGLRRNVRPLMVSGVSPATFSSVTPSRPMSVTRNRPQAGRLAASAQMRMRSLGM